MAIKLTVRVGGEVGSTTWDVTPQLPTFDESGTPAVVAGHMYGGDGNATQFEFDVDDDLGEIPRVNKTKNLASHNVVTISENATGTEYWTARGRIADKGWGRRTVEYGDSRGVTVTVDDGNTDVRGLALVADWVRPVESGRARTLAALAAFCNGSPRLTTVIGTHLVAAGLEVSMPAHTYPAATDLSDIFRDCAEVEGKVWGIVIHHLGGSHLCMQYIDDSDHTTYLSTLSITDTSPNLTTSFPPIWDQGDATTESGGDTPVSHLVSRYGTDAFVVSTDTTRIEGYDYWAVPYNDSFAESAGQAQSRADAILGFRRVEHITHRVTIRIPATLVHLVEAGMSIAIRAAAAHGGQFLGTTQTRRIGQCKKEIVAPGSGGQPAIYDVHLQIDRPDKRLAERKGSLAYKSDVPNPPASSGGLLGGGACVDANLKISGGTPNGAPACDLNPLTSWGTNGFPVSAQWFGRDYLSAITAAKTRIIQTTVVGNAATTVKVYATNDLAKWTAATGQSYDFDTAGWTVLATLTGLPTGDSGMRTITSGSYRYLVWRATAGGGNGWTVHEFELYSAGDTLVGGPAATTGTDSGTYAPIDHDHDSVDNSDVAGGDLSGTYPNPTVIDHASIASGNLHPEYASDADLTTHAAAADPHTGYQKESEKAVANGYASLGANGLVPVAQLATGTPDGTKFVRDDGTLVVPGGGGGSLTVQDEGTQLATAATTLNFTGAGVTATGAGATKTVDIPGGGGSGAAALPLDVAAGSVGSGDSFAGTTLAAAWSDLQTTALTTKDASIEGHLILGNSAAIGANVHRGIDKAFSPAGDFSVWTKVQYLRYTGNYSGVTLLFGATDPSDGAGGDRCQIYLYNSGTAMNFAFEKFAAGVRTNVSGSTVQASPLLIGAADLMTGPIWVALRRVGTTVSWGMSIDGVEWTWHTTTTTIAFTVATIGLAINSHTTANPPRSIFDYIATTG